MPAVNDAFNNDDSVLGRFLTTAAHLMLYAIAVIAVARLPYYLGIDHWAVGFGEFVATLLVLVGVMHNVHRRLCVRCMQEVPTDPSGRVQRQHRVLWFNHELATTRGILVYIGLVVGGGLSIRVFGLPRAAHLPIDAAFVTSLYSMWLHHRLRPWCPYCRPWDDDDAIEEPSPDPVVKATR
ncbi:MULTISPECIES: hypothetical protein [Nocardia]|uniref:hypothetical protein n=1 Tax=Nocardia TaxID=1817 RepID=UPI000D691054|nr:MULTISPECIES: hypothetical protein [Nocardia]